MVELRLTVGSGDNLTIAVIALVGHHPRSGLELTLRIVQVDIIAVVHSGARNIVSLITRFAVVWRRLLPVGDLLGLLQSLLVFNVLEVVLHIFDVHIFGFKALLLVDVFHDVHFKPLTFLIFNRHTSIDIGWRFFLDLALSSLSARHRSAYSRWHPHPFFVLIVLVFNVIAEIIGWHAVNLFCGKLPLLLLPLTISLFLSS